MAKKVHRIHTLPDDAPGALVVASLRDLLPLID